MNLSMLELAGQIAVMKDTDYKNTLAVSTLVELLIDKGIFSREEFAQKARSLDQASLAEIIAARRARPVTAKAVAAMPPLSPQHGGEQHIQA